MKKFIARVASSLFLGLCVATMLTCALSVASLWLGLVPDLAILVVSFIMMLAFTIPMAYFIAIVDRRFPLSL